MSAFMRAMDTRTVTENGAPCVSDRGLGDATLALFVKLVRGLSDDTLYQLFQSARAEATTPEAIADLFVLTVQTRATRGAGKGEKALFYKLMLLLAEAFGTEAVCALLPLVPSYGYWKDLLALVALKPAAPVADAALRIMCEQLKEDERELLKATEEKRTPKLSLCGKYAPREGSAFDKAPLKLAKTLAARLYGANTAAAARKYRKLVASLNAALNTTEVLMAANRWEEIKFASVASLCLQRCRKAFLNETLKGKLTPAQEATGDRHPDDAARVAARQNLRAAIESKKGVQGKQLGPHEIAAKLMGSCYSRHGRSNVSALEADLLDAQWASMRSGVVEAMAAVAEARAQAALDANAPAATGIGSMGELEAALPKSVDLGKLVALVDVSGSMGGTPMEVAIGLGILVSELSHAAFRNRVLTFESRPSWVDLSECGSIREKVAAVERAPWGGSTDFAAACERILAAAEVAKLKPDEIPDLVVFSDMQFDEAGGHGRWETHFERIQRRFAEVGMAICGEPYAAPRIIFWNLRSSVGFPVAKDAPNTQLLSGFSPSLLKLVLAGADLVGEEEKVVQADGSVKVVKSGPTPAETLRTALDDKAFDAVRLKLAALEVGPLAGYSFEREDAGFALVDVE